MRTGDPPTKVTFLRTRGGIKLRSRWHWYHSALLIEQAGARVMIDCGADWLGRLYRIRPGAILLTHAHPDHAAGLSRGAPCTVYAPPRTFELLRRYPIEDKREMPLRGILTIGELKFEAIPVQHSIRAPAAGFKVSSQDASLFYVPDIAAFSGALEALKGVHLYIGDGATITRPMVRKWNGTLIGHAPIAQQLRCVQKQAFATPFLPIADLRSWAGTRGSSMRKSRSLASSRHYSTARKG